MATAADLIRRSLKLLGILAAAEPLSAADQADGLIELNAMLGTWANERLQVFGTRRATYALTPSLSPHTIGTGGTLSTTRPVRIERAGVIRVGETAETPLTLLSDAQYAEVGNKAQTDTAPSQLWVEWTHPTAKLWLWPVPSSAATLVLYTWSRIAAFAASDTVSLPDGYDNALAHALALQVAPMYGVEPSGLLVQNAGDALAAIKRANMQTPQVEVDPALLRHGAFDIYGGG